MNFESTTPSFILPLAGSVFVGGRVLTLATPARCPSGMHQWALVSKDEQFAGTTIQTPGGPSTLTDPHYLIPVLWGKVGYLALWEASIPAKPDPVALVRPFSLADGTEVSTVRPGVVVLMGTAASGKSSLLNYVTQRVINVGENGYEPGGNVHPSGELWSVGTAIERALAASEGSVGVDSLRSLAILDTGNLGAGGVSRGMVETLSALDRAALGLGKSIITIVNLVTSDDKAISAGFELFAATLTGAVRLSSVARAHMGHIEVKGGLSIRPAMRAGFPLSMNVPV